MDNLQDYELELLTDNIGWSYKNEWEIARLESYCSLCSFGKPKKKLTEIFPLVTDNDNQYNYYDNVIDENEVKKMKLQQEKILNLINGNTNKS